MNAHVAAYYRALCQAAAAKGDYFHQWLYYTWAKLEQDPNWKAQ